MQVKLRSEERTEPRRLRSDGVLTREQVRLCREQGVALGYDCAQNGWVLLDCVDDFADGFGDEDSVVASSSSSAGTRGPDIAAADEQHLAVEVALAASAAATAGVELARMLPEAARRARRGSGVMRAPDFVYRPWEAADVAAYHELFGNPAVWRWLPDAFPEPFDVAMAHAMIELASCGDHHEVLAVEHRGAVVGQVRLLFQPQYRSVRAAEVAYALGEKHWGKGLMTQILRDFTQYVFARDELDVLYAWIMPAHAASIRVAQHAGFRRDTFEHVEAVARLHQRAGFERYLRTRESRSDSIRPQRVLQG